MGKNKVVFGGETVIDLTEDTITSKQLRKGYVAHGADGDQLIGSLTTAALEPLYYDYNIGYISAGTWVYENPTKTYTDIYEVVGGDTYIIMLGKTVGSRFRAMFTTEDVTQRTSDSVAGTQIINLNSPASYKMTSAYVPPSDGYILVAKDNVGKSGLYSYCFDITAFED